jgi:hypothetical protein
MLHGLVEVGCPGVLAADATIYDGMWSRKQYCFLP